MPPDTSWGGPRSTTAQARQESAQATFDTADTRVAIPQDIWGPPDEAGLRYAVVSISTRHPMFAHWVKPILVTLRNRAGLLDIVGIERPADASVLVNARR
jgi:hypothetical protein